MGIESYGGIGKPDEKTTIGVTNPLCNIVTAFREWSAEADQHRNLLILLEEAVTFLRQSQLRSHQKAISHLIDNEFPFTHKYMGIFYTALLNTELVKYVTITQPGLDNVWYGFQLEKGILEVKAPDSNVFGDYGNSAKGGCIINRKRTHVMVGWHAEGGLFINLGAGYLGAAAEAGTFINYGTSYGCTACHSKPTALYIDYLSRQHRWEIYRGHGLETEWFAHSHKAKKNVLIVNDTSLTLLCKKLKEATATENSIELVKRIEERCKQYEPY